MNVPRFRKTDCTYILCPDKSCKSFKSKKREGFLCDRKCPNKAAMAVVCWHCKKVITLPHDHFSFRRVDCPHCGASNFQRMSGTWRRYYV